MHRYAAIALGAGFLAMVVTFFPSTAPQLSSVGTALSPVAGTPGPRTSDHASASGAAGTLPSSEALLGSGGSSGSAYAGVGGSLTGNGFAASTAPTSSSSAIGAGGFFGSGSGDGSTVPSGGLAPAPIKPASSGSSAPSCPLPPLSIPDAGKVPQAESLLAAVTGLCAVLTTVPALVPELPSILTALPTALAHGTLPGPLDKLVQALAFDVVIPLVSVLPLPSTIPTQFPAERFTQTLAMHPGTSSPTIASLPGNAIDAGADPAGAWPRAGHWATGSVLELTQPATPSTELISALQKAAQAEAPVTVVLSPAPTIGGDQSAFATWLARTASEIPAGVTTLLSARSEDSTPSTAPLAAPGELAHDLQVLRGALGAESASGLALPARAPLPSTTWWSELGSALRATTAPRGPLVDLVAGTISGASGCSALPRLASDVAAAGLGSVPEVVSVGPESGGFAARAAGRTCLSASAHLPATLPLLLQQDILAGTWRA